MPDTQKHTMATQLVITALLIGLAAGVLSGLVGVGGGIIMVPALVFLCIIPSTRRRVLPWRY